MNHSASHSAPSQSAASEALETQALSRAALEWAKHDPSPATAAALEDLVQRASSDPAAAAELVDSFSGTLQFGTAGLRAVMGPGPNRMNRTVVRRAAAGVAAHLLETAKSDAGTDGYVPRAVIGFDARHNSADFAADTAAIFQAAGITTFLMPAPLPTPILAYAVRALNCEAGVMVTASHNPALDNGYKVYLGGLAVEPEARGVQIVAPHDAKIASYIDAVSKTELYGNTANIALAEEGWTVLEPTLVQDYVNEVAALCDKAALPYRDLKIVHTSMHGVGHETAMAVLKEAGFEDVHAVAEQSQPDPDFPTVSFPNPEEPGAMDLAFALAREVGADIVLANDPDADRAAVGALDPASGEWRKLHGDEVGALLGAHIAVRGGSLSKLPAEAPAPVFANSIVSSRLLSRIATSAGYEHKTTLTGFKWISRVAGLTFGYEEALGYCVAPEVVRDKDGMSAGMILAELAAALKSAGRTLFDLLDDLAVTHGLHVSDQLSIRVKDLALIGTMMDTLRKAPPHQLAGSRIVETVDLSLGSPELPATDGMLFLTESGSRLIVRPSGTEPKLKCYIEVVEHPQQRSDIPAARQSAATSLAAIRADIPSLLGQ